MGLLESERFDKIIKKEGNFLGTKFGSFMKERGLIIRRTKLEIHEERFDHRGKKEKLELCEWRGLIDNQGTSMVFVF